NRSIVPLSRNVVARNIHNLTVLIRRKYGFLTCLQRDGPRSLGCRRKRSLDILPLGVQPAVWVCVSKFCLFGAYPLTSLYDGLYLVFKPKSVWGYEGEFQPCKLT